MDDSSSGRTSDAGGEVFGRFLEELPICGMACVTLEKMFAADVANDFFCVPSQVQYERELLPGVGFSDQAWISDGNMSTSPMRCSARHRLVRQLRSHSAMFIQIAEWGRGGEVQSPNIAPVPFVQ